MRQRKNKVRKRPSPPGGYESFYKWCKEILQITKKNAPTGAFVSFSDCRELSWVQLFIRYKGWDLHKTHYYMKGKLKNE